MTTGAKMILHDWQRGKIPFFVPPPKQEDDESLEPELKGLDPAEADNCKASAAFKAIASVISSQQQMNVPVQRDLFTDTELKGEANEPLPTIDAEDEEEEAASESEPEEEEAKP